MGVWINLSGLPWGKFQSVWAGDKVVEVHIEWAQVWQVEEDVVELLCGVDDKVWGVLEEETIYWFGVSDRMKDEIKFLSEC